MAKYLHKIKIIWDISANVKKFWTFIISLTLPREPFGFVEAGPEVAARVWPPSEDDRAKSLGVKCPGSFLLKLARLEFGRDVVVGPLGSAAMPSPRPPRLLRPLPPTPPPPPT